MQKDKNVFSPISAVFITAVVEKGKKVKKKIVDNPEATNTSTRPPSQGLQ